MKITSIVDKEKKKAKSTRVKGTTPQGAFTIPPFGSASSQLPTTLDQPGKIQQRFNWIAVLATLHHLKKSSTKFLAG